MTKKIKFPKTPDELKLCWIEGTGEYIALVETEEMIKLYRWDGFSESYNEVLIFEKVKIKN